jgi:hypothetical protein
MAARTLIDTRILVGSTDISQFTGSLDIVPTVNMVEGNVFRAGGFVRTYPGLKKTTTSFDGFADYDTGAPGSVFTPASVGGQYTVSAAPHGDDAAGDPVSFTRGIMQQLSAPGGAVGAMATLGMVFESDQPMVHGQIAAPLLARTVTANGAILTLPGPLLGERLFAGLNVTAVAGTTPSLTVAVQSATLIGFGSPTTRATMTAVTAPGDQWIAIPGPVTDGFWRVTFTITGTTPSFTCAVALGVA